MVESGKSQDFFQPPSPKPLKFSELQKQVKPLIKSNKGDVPSLPPPLLCPV